jgi:hypothetical protein
VQRTYLALAGLALTAAGACVGAGSLMAPLRARPMVPSRAPLAQNQRTGSAAPPVRLSPEAARALAELALEKAAASLPAPPPPMASLRPSLERASLGRPGQVIALEVIPFQE